jgi:hypothetical protein
MPASKPQPATPSAPNPAPDLEILSQTATLRPPAYIAPAAAAVAPTPERNLVANMSKFRESPLAFLREVSLHVSGTGWRAYDTVVGQPIFYKGFSARMRAAVMAAPMLRARIDGLAAARVEVEARAGLVAGGAEGTERRAREIREGLEVYAEGLVEDMICKMESKTFIRGAYYAATQLLTRAYNQGVSRGGWASCLRANGMVGIHVSSEEVLRLREVAVECERKKQSIIFLPCHRSHVDYVSLQLICYRLGIALPTVVGELPGAGQQFVRLTGA